eukprot:scaffold5638_cov102-Skeletonema_dohrnii-CCMP3373.AAC.3
MADNEEDLVDYDEEEEEQNVAAEEAADAEGKEVKNRPFGQVMKPMPVLWCRLTPPTMKRSLLTCVPQCPAPYNPPHQIKIVLVDAIQTPESLFGHYSHFGPWGCCPHRRSTWTEFAKRCIG